MAAAAGPRRTGDKPGPAAGESRTPPRPSKLGLDTYPDLAPGTAELPYAGVVAGLPLALIVFCVMFLIVKGGETKTVLLEHGLTEAAGFVLWPDYTPYAPAAAYAGSDGSNAGGGSGGADDGGGGGSGDGEAAPTSVSPFQVFVICGVAAAAVLVNRMELPLRVGRMCARRGVSTGSMAMLRTGLYWAVGPSGFPAALKLTPSLDPKFGMDRDGWFTPLTGRERGCNGSTKALASAAHVYDECLRMCMQLRREGRAFATTEAMEGHLMLRLTRVLVCVRRDRVAITVDASLSVKDGVKMTAHAAADTGTGGPQLDDEGNVRGAPEGVWLRQPVVRALSPAIYARVSTCEHLRGDSDAPVNAALRCAPAPVTAKAYDALKAHVEAAGGKWAPGGARYGPSGTGSLHMFPTPVALCFALGSRPEMLAAAVAAGADPDLCVGATDYKSGSGSTCAQSQPCTLRQAAEALDAFHATAGQEGKADGVSLVNAIARGLDMRRRMQRAQ